ncbi:MAG: AAA family ATPase [Candidatus Melainabacteria bacterium]|nr:AAA family ATPase [Candidatus Melainabacteria bacterium]
MQELDILIRARYPLVYLITPEEDRALGALAQVVDEQSFKPLYVWSVTQGFRSLQRNGQGLWKPGQFSQTAPGTISPEAALDFVIKRGDPTVFVFKDLHPFLESPGVIRWLRDAVGHIRNERLEQTIIVLSPVMRIPAELEKDVAVVDFCLPTIKELGVVFDQVYNDGQVGDGHPSQLSPDTREVLLRAALGLTVDEAEKVYTRALISAGKLTECELDIVLSEKKQVIRRSQILEFHEESKTLEHVGGLENLKKWFIDRSGAFSEKARDYGLPQPKGLLLLGVPGCGKSLVAKTVSNLWNLPLLKLDMGRVFASLVGSSEQNLRSVLRTAESLAPCLLFTDEVDKAFGGMASSMGSDGGTAARVFGTFLTWMQEKVSPVFVIATANRVDRLPGEFLRKGRFDEIFFIDLPNPQEREAILRIHLSMRRKDVISFDVGDLAARTSGFSGAEIEQAIISAMYEAFADDGREFSQFDIIRAIEATKPLSQSMAEQVTALREWAQDRARMASCSPTLIDKSEYLRMESSF